MSIQGQTENCIQALTNGAQQVMRLKTNLERCQQKCQFLQEQQANHGRDKNSAELGQGSLITIQLGPPERDVDMATREATRLQNELQDVQRKLEKAKFIAFGLIRQFEQEERDQRYQAQLYASGAGKVNVAGAAQDLASGSNIAYREAQHLSDLIRQLKTALNQACSINSFQAQGSLEDIVLKGADRAGPSDFAGAGNEDRVSRLYTDLFMTSLANPNYTAQLEDANRRQAKTIENALRFKREQDRMQSHYYGKRHFVDLRPYPAIYRPDLTYHPKAIFGQDHFASDKDLLPG